MFCPPVRGDNPRALVSGLSLIQVDNHGIMFLLHTRVHLVHYYIFRAKVGKGGIRKLKLFQNCSDIIQ